MTGSPALSSELQQQWQLGRTHAAQGQWRQAADCFSSIIAQRPDYAPVLLEAADALLRLDRYRDARQCVLQASAQVAGFPRLLVKTCQRLHSLGETGALLGLVAGCDLDKALWMESESAGLTELASLLSSSGDQAGARPLIDRAVSTDPGNARARYMLGVIAMFQGEMALARSELEACLTVSPSFAQAHWVLSSLEPAKDPNGQAVDRIRACIAQVTPWSNDEAYLAFALHNQLHAHGRYEEAWQALQRGCEIKRRLVAHDPQRVVELFSQLKSSCTSEFVGSAARQDDEFTPIFIIGMHRSGTTLLERILAGHNQVADGGETHAFTTQLNIATDHRAFGTLDSVTIERLAHADFDSIGTGFLASCEWRRQGKPFMTEKLPQNLVNAAFIAKALPGARILHMVRNPADTCFSNLRTYFNDVATYSYDQLQLADYHAQYQGLMRHWHEVMPGRILDVSYDELVADTETTARRIFSFCGLPFEQDALAIEKSGSAVATASSAYVRSGILANRGAAWKPYERHLQPMLDRLSKDDPSGN